MRERHGDHEHINRVHTRQKRAGQDLIVGAYAPNQLCQNHAVDKPMRVIGHDNHRALLGDAAQLVFGRLQLDPHDFQRVPPKALAEFHAAFFKLADQIEQVKLAGKQLHHADGEGLERVGEGVGVRQVALVIGDVDLLFARPVRGGRFRRIV